MSSSTVRTMCFITLGRLTSHHLISIGSLKEARTTNFQHPVHRQDLFYFVLGAVIMSDEEGDEAGQAIREMMGFSSFGTSQRPKKGS